MDRITQGTLAHLPIVNNPETGDFISVPPDDCLALIGQDRLIPRGITEGAPSYGARLQRSIDSWRLGASARAMLSQALGYLLAFTPQVRIVWSTFDKSVWPPFLQSSTWDTYQEGRDPNIEPVHVRQFAGGAGEFDWDSLSPITGSWGSWSCYMVFYATSQAWIAPAQPWGEGSVYSPSADGYYSEVVGGAYQLAGSYSGTSRAWGAGSTYTPSASGYYSTVNGGAYVGAGRYSGASQAWGVNTSAGVGLSLAQIAKLFKLSNAWVRALIVSFDDALFDPSSPPGGGINPDGQMGQWSKVVGGEYVPSRFTDAVYGGEVI